MSLALDADPFELLARSYEAPTESAFLRDPVGWVREKLGEHMWSRQREIAESVVEHKRTAVQSCHGVGKSWTAARITAWWLDSHPVGEAFVVTTAPSFPQVRAILWREIGKAHRKGALVGRVNQTEWHIGPEIVAYGRKPSDYDENSFQGIHSRYVLVILDEACGIPAQLWTAVESITTNADCRILAIGNPDDPGTEFGKVCKPGSGWNVIRISAFDSPNFTDEPVPQELRPYLIAPEWVEDKRTRWGIESPLYTSKVLGKFPENSEDTLISATAILAAQARTLGIELPEMLGVDVARFGSDETVIYARRGPVVRHVSSHRKQPTTETTGQVIAAMREHHITEARVDGVGVGGGVVDMLAEQGHEVVDMQAGAGATDTRLFANARAEWWWELRRRFEAGEIDIDPADDELAAQLGSIRYRYTSRGQVLMESKDDMKARGMPSPDRADAVVLAFAVVPDVIEGDQYEPAGYDDYDIGVAA